MVKANDFLDELISYKQNKIDLSIYTRCLIMLILQRFTSCFSLITLTVQVLELLYLTFCNESQQSSQRMGHK